MPAKARNEGSILYVRSCRILPIKHSGRLDGSMVRIASTVTSTEIAHSQVVGTPPGYSSPLWQHSQPATSSSGPTAAARTIRSRSKLPKRKPCFGDVVSTFRAVFQQQRNEPVGDMERQCHHVSYSLNS